MNPLFQQMNPQNGTKSIVSQIQNLKKNFHGDPQQVIQQMLNSGRISQQQYNEAVQRANQIAQMLGMK